MRRAIAILLLAVPAQAHVPAACQIEGIHRHHTVEGQVIIEFVCNTKDLVDVVPHLVLAPEAADTTTCEEPEPVNACDPNRDGRVDALDLAECRALLVPVIR